MILQCRNDVASRLFSALSYKIHPEIGAWQPGRHIRSIETKEKEKPCTFIKVAVSKYLLL